MTVRIVTFDLDDTLWDVAPVLQQAERQTFDWLAQRCPEMAQRFSIDGLRELKQQLVSADPQLQYRISAARFESIAEALRRCGRGDDEARAIARDAFAVFLDARHQVELFDEAAETLAELAEEFTLGVLTNGNADVRRLPVGSHFSFSFCAEDVGAAKPDDAIFRAAAAHCGARPSEIVHIGDHVVNDIEGAARLGWHTVWVNLQGAARPDGTTPTDTVERLGELPAAIRRISRGQL